MRASQDHQHQRYLRLLSTTASDPASHIVNPSFGPIQAPDGTTVAASISDLANCSPSRNACLLAPINKDIHGNQVTDDINIWTAALPDGAINGDSSTNCQDWTSNSAFDTGIGGTAGSTSIGFTTRMHDTCDNTHRLMCL
jgi:hypothetical protein